MINTLRLILRRYSNEDVLKVYAVINNDNIAKNMLRMPYPYPIEQIPIWFHFIERNEFYKRGYEYGIFNKQKEYIGHIGLVNRDKDRAELTYFVGEPYWNQGYATEAVKAMIDFGFTNLKLEHIEARCLATNAASARVMEKGGLIRCDERTYTVYKNGNFIEVWLAALSREDYILVTNKKNNME